MDSTESVSKGCFVFKNGFSKSKYRQSAGTSKKSAPKSQYLTGNSSDESYYQSYSTGWSNIQANIDNIQKESFNQTIKDLIDFTSTSYNNNLDSILPAAALLTGINQPDHMKQFTALSARISKQLGSKSVIIESNSCATLKSAVEAMVFGLIGGSNAGEAIDLEYKQLKKSQCTIQVLEAWYLSQLDQVENDKLIVIIPDFECFKSDVLQDLILILSSHCHHMPIVLIFGVATAITALHNALPYHVSSKIRIEVFQSLPATTILNQIIEKAILTPIFPFRLSGKCFQFLTDIFLFYDFSISGFVQAFKFAFLEHYFRNNMFGLCTNYDNSLKIVKQLNNDDLQSIRQLMSFRPYVDSMENGKEMEAMLTDDEFLRRKLPPLLRECQIYLCTFRCFLEFFRVLVDDLPKAPLGRNLRELYANFASYKAIDMPEFKELIHIISFLSKEEFINKISKAVEAVKTYIKYNLGKDDISQATTTIISKTLNQVSDLVDQVSNAKVSAQKNDSLPENELKAMNRQELKDKLLKMVLQDKPISEFTKTVQKTLKYVTEEIVNKHLRPFNKNPPPLIELFVYFDVSNIRNRIVGTPRATVHRALNDPHYYLECDCCRLDDPNNILPTMLDLSIVYKLHLERGRQINLYDLLQSFCSIIDNNTDVDNDEISPEIQARFTQAVAELQFLGFIKPSKRKTDYVTKLTW